MRRVGKIAMIWLLLPLLAGCWDIKDIQEINYVTSIGFDLDNNRYRAYVQMLDFSSVAKTESSKPTQPMPVWVGVGTGETLIGAFNDLYKTSQMRTSFGQLNTVVIGEGLMKTGMKDVKELLSRYYEFRYTPWVFGSRQPIDELFEITPFFNLSPLMSVLNQPLEVYKQQSLIAPLTLREFISETREPGNSTFLPSLSISSHTWRNGNQQKPMLKIDGVFVFQREHFQKWFDWESVQGLRWVEPKTERSPLLLRSEGKPQASVSLEKPKINIVPQAGEDQVTFHMNVKISGYISEILQQPIPETVLELRVAEEVKKQIKDTYEEGLKKNLDLMHLEHALYRLDNREWKKWRDRGGLNLTPDSLNMTVEVKLNHSGKIKY
ncbi:Ger(x)C family spore germination protein [Paenibacillus sp. GCM10023248]|uniref:Ger(x)C family spore germination protein n=1 Tax=unclassified Paenibacillus TaxID=185978 RepID=UPI002379698D|nr:Ger(x)C family spore germination protein [Paenibacillus sp. MAHUQ-63]MDD9265418.1 Ger(x)C family spore germination protein [Paenibacillus sp. MAHUQ-63]